MLFFAAKAVTSPLSIPPDKNIPKGASEINRFLTAIFKRFSTLLTASKKLTLVLHPKHGTDQYLTFSKRPPSFIL